MTERRPRTIDATQPITALPGVGKARAACLARLAVYTVGDLLRLRPHRYLDFRRIAQPCDLQPGDSVTVSGRVEALTVRHTRRRGTVLCEARLRCSSGDVILTWFLGSWAAARAPVRRGQLLLASGIVTRRLNGLPQIIGPLVEPVGDTVSGRIIPVYPLTRGLKQSMMRRYVAAALPALTSLPDPIPTRLLARHGLPSLLQALTWLHQPPTLAATEEARSRFVYEEVLILTIAMKWRKRTRTQHGPQCGPDDAKVRSFFSHLPYSLTQGQRDAIGDIRADMESCSCMQRLVHGDVGSGKTTVAMYAVSKATENGLQAAMLVPTRLLAEQHLTRWLHFLAKAGVQTALLVGDRQEGNVHELIEGRQVDFVIGTHALLNAPFARLGLLIVDEQHRFGVEQRASLARRWGAHCLYLTATPIPRSLALVAWGDLDVSVIPGVPKGRPTVETRWLLPHKRAEVYRFVRQQVEAGRQAYIVFPRIAGDESDMVVTPTLERSANGELSASVGYDYLRTGPLANLRVALLHGRMAAVEQEEVMEAFCRGEIDVLVSTSIIEVGIDVPNATTMVIEQADLFGLAQLHQLRGRVGRGAEKSYCILVTAPRTPEGLQRIQLIRRVSDGFVLAGEDLRLRGPGEVLGERQSGYGELQHARLPTDLGILQAAQVDAQELVSQDPALEAPCHSALRVELLARFPSLRPV